MAEMSKLAWAEACARRTLAQLRAAEKNLAEAQQRYDDAVETNNRAARALGDILEGK